MAAETCRSRSLGPTLIDAASTLALFVVTGSNYELPTFKCAWHDAKEFAREFSGMLMALMVMPFQPCAKAVVNVLRVWMLRRRLISRHNLKLDVGYVTTMTFCRIYIEVREAEAQHGLGRVHSWSVLEHSDPLQVNCYVEERAAGNFQYLELLPKHQREALLVVLQQPSKDLLERMEHARDRRRSVVANVVRAVQAVGYVWSALERIVQHLEISPVEAILAFLSLLVCLQLLLELYACDRYSRVLVLRLSPDHLRKLSDEYDGYSEHHTQLIRMIRVSLALILCLLSVPFLYYSYTFRHTCRLCSISTLFFFVEPILFFVVLLMQHVFDKAIKDHFIIIFIFVALFLGFTMVLLPTSIVLALVATIQNWERFNLRSTNILYAWVLPHLSS